MVNTRSKSARNDTTITNRMDSYTDNENEWSVTEILSRNQLAEFDYVENLAYRQFVVPPETTEAIIRTIHDDPMQGHPGASKMLAELRKKYYVPNLTEKVQAFVNNCQICIKTKAVKPNSIKPPLEPNRSTTSVHKAGIVGTSVPETRTY